MRCNGPALEMSRSSIWKPCHYLYTGVFDWEMRRRNAIGSRSFFITKKKNVEEEKSYYLNKGRVCAARDERRRLKFVLQGRCHYGTGMSRGLVSFFFFFNPPGENLLLS